MLFNFQLIYLIALKNVINFYIILRRHKNFIFVCISVYVHVYIYVYVLHIDIVMYVLQYTVKKIVFAWKCDSDFSELWNELKLYALLISTRFEISDTSQLLYLMAWI